MSDLATPGHDLHDRRPTWIVQTVFDPDGGGKDFGYTIGLHDLGHPELHLWGRPGLGEDPGEDWMFSPCDRGRILNELAWQLIDGTLGVGACLTRTYDDGEALVRFEIRPPGDIEELEAYGVAPGALVLPVQWSLTRPPDGPSRALAGRHLAEARALRRQVLDGLDRDRTPPPSWESVDRPSWRRDQRWGPLTPVVLARGEQLWQAGVDELSWLVSNALDIREAGSLTWPVTLATAAARRSGRRHALARLHDDVIALVDHLAEDPSSQVRWRELMTTVWGGGDQTPVSVRRGHAALKSLLVDVTLGCLCVEAVADVIDPAVLVQGRGGWVEALEPGDDLPPGTWASPEVLEVVRGLLHPLTLDQLGELATLHALARDAEGSSSYPLIVMRLRGWAVTGPAGCPWRPTIGALPQWREHAGDMAHLLGFAAEPHQDLREWASLVTSALTYRTRLSAEDIDVVTAPFRRVLPDLSRVLNEPVVRG